MKIPTRLHKIYEHMMYRCYNPKSVNYKYYGARGIGVCEEWRNNPMLFKKWALSNGYNSTLTLDRIDSNKGYSPDNCRWVTMKDQSINKRNTVMVTYKGETKPFVVWCEELGLDATLVRTRVYHGKWSYQKAFETELRPKYKLITYNGKTQSMKEWAKEFHINYQTLKTRIRKGWNIEKALKEKAA